MKILFATPYNGSIGGIVQWAENIVNYYESEGRRDCGLDVLSMSDASRGDVVIGRSLIKRIYYGVRTYSKVLIALKQKLRQNEYDVLHISSSASISLAKDLLMIKIAKRHKLKTIMHFHFGRIPQLVKKSNWEWRLLNRVMKCADASIVMDEASYDSLKGIAGLNIYLIPNPLGEKVEKIAAQNSNTKREDRTLAFVGHIVKTKGVYELVEACKDIPNIKLRLVGPVTDVVKDELLSIVSGANWLHFVGMLPTNDVINEMSLCSIFVLPTYTEGFPNVILESMACGCAIVTTPVGAIPEMLQFGSDNPCGVYVEPANVIQLKEAIEKLLADKVMAQSYGERAKKRVQSEYAISTVWLKMVDVWYSVMVNQLKNRLR